MREELQAKLRMAAPLDLLLTAAEESNRVQYEKLVEKAFAQPKVKSTINSVKAKIAGAILNTDPLSTSTQSRTKKAVIHNGFIYLSNTASGNVSEDMIKFSYKPRQAISILLDGKSLDNSK
jgi:hypothetical protein